MVEILWCLQHEGSNKVISKKVLEVIKPKKTIYDLVTDTKMAKNFVDISIDDKQKTIKVKVFENEIENI